MADLNSGIPLPSREAQEICPATPWQTITSPKTDETNSKASLALAILSEKIKSGALQPSELMQRIVAQAAAATAAKGVALALRQPDGPVVCCACTGEMAPPPGTPLNESSGFTAECLRNGVFIVCEDSETDARVDRVACSRLGVRSIVAVPVESGDATVGVLEALSDQVAAFTKQHIELLLTLACFAKSAMAPPEPEQNWAIKPPSLLAVAVANPAPALEADALRAADLLARVEDIHIWSDRMPRRVRLAIAGGVAAALLLALFATAVLLWMWRQNARAEIGKARTKPKVQQATLSKPPAGLSTPASQHAFPTHARVAADHKPPLVVKASAVEKITSPEPRKMADEITAEPSAEKEVAAPEAFTPLTRSSTQELSGILASPEVLPTTSIATSQGVTPARLKRRIEPVYPAEAKRLRIEGPVVLRAAIDEEGRVRSVGLVNGSPILAKAAMAAVQQWRYQPSELNHRPAASTTDITIVFHLQ